MKKIIVLLLFAVGTMHAGECFWGWAIAKYVAIKHGPLRAVFYDSAATNLGEIPFVEGEWLHNITDAAEIELNINTSEIEVIIDVNDGCEMPFLKLP